MTRADARDGRTRWHHATAGALLAALTACGQPATEVPPTPASVAAQPGLWGVSAVAAEHLPSALPEPRGRGSMAARSGGTAAAATIAAGAVAAVLVAFTAGGQAIFLGPALFIGGLALAPVVGGAAAAGGASAASSEADRTAAAASLQAALAEARSDPSLTEVMIAQVRTTAGRTLVDCGDAHVPTACAEAPDVLLRLSLAAPDFEQSGSADPALRLLQRLDATVIATGVVEPVYHRAWRYRGAEQRYFALAADNAQLLGAELVRAREALLARAAADLFRPGAVERHATGEQPEGSVWTIVPPGMPAAQR